jgi:hypothetical protein
MAKSRRFPVSRRAIAPAILGLVAAGVLVLDVGFCRRAERGVAMVREATVGMRSGLSIADVEHEVAGTPILAELRAWFHLLPVGEQVPIRYRPERPEEVYLDSFWQLHYASAAILILFAGVSLWECCASLEDRRASRVEDSFPGD